MTHGSYVSFVEEVVLPRQANHPADLRLDGEPTGGNMAVAGTFMGEGREWRVHEDSHYEPLLAAYEAFKEGDPWPFVEEPTKTGSSLDLKPELRARLSNRRHKYLYIYSI